MGGLFQWETFVFYLPRVLESLGVSVFISIVAAIFSTILALFGAFIRIERISFLNQIVIVFVSFFRGTSLYIQLFLFYFGIPKLFSSFGLSQFASNPMIAVLLAFTFNRASFLIEVFRASFYAVPSSQYEAALSLGFSKYVMYKRLIIPQAFRIALPSYINSLVNLIQDTSLAFTVGIIDMMGKVKILQSRTGRAFEGYIIVALVYIMISIAMHFVSKSLAKRESLSMKKRRLN